MLIEFSSFYSLALSFIIVPISKEIIQSINQDVTKINKTYSIIATNKNNLFYGHLSNFKLQKV